ncbi:UNVERIFIED_CONTAM: hypothetical protein EX528_14275 [Xanthomonas axonopodis]
MIDALGNRKMSGSQNSDNQNPTFGSIETLTNKHGGELSTRSLATSKIAEPWCDPLYKRFDVELSGAGLALQQACQSGNLDAVISMRHVVSMIEASLHALPIAADAGQIAVIQELLSWPLWNLQGVVFRFIGPLAEKGQAEVVDCLVSALLTQKDPVQLLLQKLLIAIACTGNAEIFHKLTKRVDSDMDWTHVTFNAVYFKHWTLAAIAWKRSDPADAASYLHDSEKLRIQKELRSWEIARERRQLKRQTIQTRHLASPIINRL